MIKARYYNYLTIPSGKRCNLYEITNENYLVLVKFAEAKDYDGFYSVLNSLIKESIPDFDNFNLIDKAYIYIAYCFYSIHESIIYKSNSILDNEISLSAILDNIENSYTNIVKNYELTQDITIKCSIPTEFLIDEDSIMIDYATGIESVNGILIESNEKKRDFIKQIRVRYSSKIESLLRRDFTIDCRLLKTPLNNAQLVNLLSGSLFQMIVQMYAEPLNEYYKLLYYNFEYLKLSYDSFMRMTPRESRMIFNQFVEDKEKQAEEQRNQIVRR